MSGFAYNYDRESQDNYLAFAKSRLKSLLPETRKVSDGRILELGCGEGSLAWELSQNSNAQIYGLDYSLSGIKLAKEKGIIAKVADLNKGIPFPDNYFDLIIADQLLEHIDKTYFLVNECRRVLKKNGILIIITPNLAYWLNRFLFWFGFYPIFLESNEYNKNFGTGFLKKVSKQSETMGHIRVFNLAALTDLLESAGLRIEKKRGLPLSFNLPVGLRQVYDLLDKLFAHIPGLARDLFVVSRKK